MIAQSGLAPKRVHLWARSRFTLSTLFTPPLHQLSSTPFSPPLQNVETSVKLSTDPWTAMKELSGVRLLELQHLHHRRQERLC